MNTISETINNKTLKINSFTLELVKESVDEDLGIVIWNKLTEIRQQTNKIRLLINMMD